MSQIVTIYQPFFTEASHGYKMSEIKAVVFPVGGTFMKDYKTKKPTAFTQYDVRIGDILYDKRDKKHYVITNRQAWTSETEFMFFELDIEPLKPIHGL